MKICRKRWKAHTHIHTHKHAENQDEQNVWQNFKSKVAATAALAPAITGERKKMYACSYGGDTEKMH